MKESVEHQCIVYLSAKDPQLISDKAMIEFEKCFREFLEEKKLRIFGRIMIRHMPEMGPANSLTVVRAVSFTDPRDVCDLREFIDSAYPNGDVVLTKTSAESLFTWNELELSQGVQARKYLLIVSLEGGKDVLANNDKMARDLREYFSRHKTFGLGEGIKGRVFFSEETSVLEPSGVYVRHFALTNPYDDVNFGVAIAKITNRRAAGGYSCNKEDPILSDQDPFTIELDLGSKGEVGS